MKRVFILLTVAAMWSCNSSSSSSDESNEQTDSTAAETTANESISAAGEFGAPLSEADITDLQILQTSLDTDNSFEGKVKIAIDDVCQMKGCWMTAKLPDGRSIRITFKDYGFFVPKNATGYTAVIEGIAEKKVTDEATLKHYAQESGKTEAEIEAISGPGEELSFVASGVVIESL